MNWPSGGVHFDSRVSVSKASFSVVSDWSSHGKILLVECGKEIFRRLVWLSIPQFFGYRNEVKALWFGFAEFFEGIVG